MDLHPSTDRAADDSRIIATARQLTLEHGKPHVVYVCSQALKLANQLAAEAKLRLAEEERSYFAALLLILCRDEQTTKDRQLWQQLGLPDANLETDRWETEMYAISMGFIEFDPRRAEEQKKVPDYTASGCLDDLGPAIWYLAPGASLHAVIDDTSRDSYVLRMVSPPPTTVPQILMRTTISMDDY